MFFLIFLKISFYYSIYHKEYLEKRYFDLKSQHLKTYCLSVKTPGLKIRLIAFNFSFVKILYIFKKKLKLVLFSLKLSYLFIILFIIIIRTVCKKIVIFICSCRRKISFLFQQTNIMHTSSYCVDTAQQPWNVFFFVQHKQSAKVIQRVHQNKDDIKRSSVFIGQGEEKGRKHNTGIDRLLLLVRKGSCSCFTRLWNLKNNVSIKRRVKRDFLACPLKKKNYGFLAIKKVT